MKRYKSNQNNENFVLALKFCPRGLAESDLSEA